VSWVQAAKGLPEHRARAARVDERLAGAGAYFASPEREALGQEPKLDALTNAVAAQPGDQELRVALASHDADATALSTIAKAWTPGQMTRSTALAYADLLQRVGKLSEAESILEQLVQRLLPEYEDARADYAEASTAFYDKWYEKANEGQLPSDIEAELKGLSGERARQVFDKWLAKQADTDTDVRAHFEHAERASGVVPMVLSLGTVKLLLASQQTGEAQAQLLAAAERLFLAIRSDAGGLPAYHLGLAQVYYRLNKVADGEREFGELLSKDEPWLKLSVARAYREVGAISRAREVTEAVHAKSESPQREAAALLMSLMADSSDDQRAWLLRSDQQNTLVQTNLLELEANSACLDGKAQEGDRKYREAAQRHLQGSELNESNFNNAALAQAARVPCTGQRAPLDEAIGLMRRALRAAPDSSLLATNAAPLYEYRGQLRVLSRWLDASALQLDSHDTGTLIDALEDGEHREELLGALKDDPDVKQSRELSRNARVLAPTQPDAYGTEAAWLARFENYQGLAALLGVVRAQKLDTGPGTVKRKQWLEGQLDKSQRERLHKVEAKLGRLGAGLQSSSLAALRYLEAELALSLMVLDDPLPRAEQAVRAFEAAGQQWPALDARRRLAEALVVTAAVRASTTMPALATLLRAETRELGWFLMLSRLVDSSDPVLTTIKAQPEFARAMDIARQLPTDHPGSWDWLLARLGEDAPRADQLMARVFDANRRSTAELGRLLSPGRASDAYLAFLDLHAPKALAAH
jgi:hypothetical protein